MSPRTANDQMANDTPNDSPKDDPKIVELSDSDDDDDDDDDDDNNNNDATSSPPPTSRRIDPDSLPPWLHQATLALFHDDLETATSDARHKTQTDCLPYLTGAALAPFDLNAHGIPHLRRGAHINFLHATLTPLPAPYAALDASRPWLFYWALAGLATLGQDVAPYRARLRATVAPLQNPTGGFGGGQGQLSHCACTYAATLALACVGGLDLIDRPAMWRWLGTLKQPSGGFLMAAGAEQDIRGAYCALTLLTLLNLPLTLPPTAPARAAGLRSFTDHLGPWIARCQGPDGGLAAAPTHEPHGAYAFCGLACLALLAPPPTSLPTYLDLPALTAWLTSTQTTPEGGFAGRTNKLVDACYSHWVGGCFALLQTALPALPPGRDVWNRAALIRYLLACCQAPGKKGGMRDKPTVRADGYHTCYALAGLSHAVNRYWYEAEEQKEEGTGRLMAAFRWRGERADEGELREWGVEEEDCVECVHPVFVIPFARVEEARVMFAEAGFRDDGEEGIEEGVGKLAV